ncbi:ATP-binding cassette domain-containing protein [Gemmobacter lutimaris]|uniref:ATP-binding cassette domain-containing protein n=1 Tax=Gemmobacter lutimaris TaxID=2306023 RepID=A0A398BTI0_9RHOB|nr:ATP-binding cassette domain-containing protein [Gemmobacter lutimaris]
MPATAASECPGLALSVTDLRVAAPGGRLLLSLPGLDLPAGRSLAVRGPSGAGKSTLLHALAGLLTDVEGAVRWGETDLLSLTDPARAAFRRARVGLVFQDFLLFEELGAEANAALAAGFAPASQRAAIRQRARSALDRLGLGGTSGRLAASFSDGERQRIAIARALAHDPAVILADEPTASLDRAAADRLIDDLVALSREDGRTLVVVSHDPALTERLDQSVEIVDGHLREGHHA